MTKSKKYLHPISIISNSSDPLESSYEGPTPDASPRSRSPWSRFRRPSTLGYEQTVVSVLKLILNYFKPF